MRTFDNLKSSTKILTANNYRYGKEEVKNFTMDGFHRTQKKLAEAGLVVKERGVVIKSFKSEAVFPKRNSALT
jgi:hypothetical protein